MSFKSELNFFVDVRVLELIKMSLMVLVVVLVGARAQAP